jgi:hypothetical protein
MLNPTSINMLANLAIEAINQVQGNRPNFSFETNPAFECKAWRSNGFSDTEIYRLTCPFGAYAIRSWPNRFDTPSKIAFWSVVNDQFGKIGFDELRRTGAVNSKPFPSLYAWHPPVQSQPALLLLDEQLWTLCDWVDGQPIERDRVDKVLVNHLAMVLGRLHFQSRKAFDLGGSVFETSDANQAMQSNSIRERFQAITRVDHRLFQTVDQSPFFSAHSLTDRVKHCLAIVLERLTDWQRFLSISSNQKRDCHWIVRDLWRENILVDAAQHFSSIVDLGASRIDWPGLDFIRLFGSLSYSTASSPLSSDEATGNLWQDAYNAYTLANPTHDVNSLEECRMLSLVSNGLSIVQWVHWIRTDTMNLKVPDKAQRVSERISELCDPFLVAAS